MNVLEMRFINNEVKPLKDVFKNTLLVFLSSLCGFYILSNINYSEVSISKPTEIFSGNPEF
jgi:hypothetical protein